MMRRNNKSLNMDCLLTLMAMALLSAVIPSIIVNGQAITLQPSAFKQMMEAGNFAAILDVRSNLEFLQGHITGASLMDSLASGGSSPRALAGCETCNIAVYCNSGARAAAAIQVLRNAGFQGMLYNALGVSQWQAAGYPLVQTPSTVPVCTTQPGNCSPGFVPNSTSASSSDGRMMQTSNIGGAGGSIPNPWGPRWSTPATPQSTPVQGPTNAVPAPPVPAPPVPAPPVPAPPSSGTAAAPIPVPTVAVPSPWFTGWNTVPVAPPVGPTPVVSNNAIPPASLPTSTGVRTFAPIQRVPPPLATNTASTNTNPAPVATPAPIPRLPGFPVRPPIPSGGIWTVKEDLQSSTRGTSIVMAVVAFLFVLVV